MHTHALQSQRPTNATYGYDFRETSAASHAVVVQKVRKADFQDKDYTGVHCCHSTVLLCLIFCLIIAAVLVVVIMCQRAMLHGLHQSCGHCHVLCNDARNVQF